MIPLYIRMCIQFILLRSSNITEDFLTKEEFAVLKDFVEYKQQCSNNNVPVDYCDYENYLYSRGDTNKDIIKSFKLSFGQFYIREIDGKIEIWDDYDFEYSSNHGTWEEFKKCVVRCFKGDTKGLEWFLYWYHRLGYKGFKTVIKI